MLVSKKEQYGKNNSCKYFIGYNDNDIIRPLFVKLPKTTSLMRKKMIANPFMVMMIIIT